MRRFRTLLQAVGANTLGFGLSTLLLTISSLVAIPAMVSASGMSAWSHIAFGQGLGTLFAALILWDWGVAGPTRIATMDENARKIEYRLSVLGRVPLFLASMPILFLLACAFGHSYFLEMFSGLAFTASMGLTSLWFFAGAGRPRSFLSLETLPRFVATVVSVLLMRAGNLSASQGVTVQMMGLLVGFVLVSRFVLGNGGGRVRAGCVRQLASEVAGSLWARRFGLARTMLNTSYQAMPIALVGPMFPGALTEFALYDKTIRQFVSGIQPLVTALQGVFPKYAGDPRRVRLLGVCCVLLASAVVGVLMPIVPLVLRYFSTGVVDVGWAVALVVSLCVGLGLLDSLLANAVLPIAGLVDESARMTLYSLIIGFPAIIFGASTGGAFGALIGLVGGLALRVALEFVMLLRRVRREPPLA